MRLERLEVSGLARAGWRLWLSRDTPPLLLLLYRNHLKVEGVASLKVWLPFVLAARQSCGSSKPAMMVKQRTPEPSFNPGTLLLLLLLLLPAVVFSQ